MYDVYKTSVNSLRRAVNKVSQKFLTFFDSVLTFQIYFNPLSIRFELQLFPLSPRCLHPSHLRSGARWARPARASATTDSPPRGPGGGLLGWTASKLAR